MRHEKGLTLVELLLVAAVVTSISVLAGPFYARFLGQNIAQETSDQMVQSLRKAQFYAMESRKSGGGGWGVNYSANTMTLYQGNTYAGRNSALDEKFEVISGVDVWGLGEINFARGTGLPTVVSTTAPTPSPTPVAGPTVAPTSTPTATPTPTPTGPTPTLPPPAAGEWTQHAHDAQRTSYTDQVVVTPWRWKWSWNGPNASGGVSKVLIYDNLLPFNGVPTAIRTLPRNLQPVTGAGRVYIAAGRDGIYALNSLNGSQVWRINPAGETNYMNSTVAYDSDTNALFAVASNGILYKMDSATGVTIDQFPSGASGILSPLPPAVLSDRVLFSMGNNVYAVNKTTMQQIWSYPAGSAAQTPPAYSPSRNRVIVVTQDLFVHAINNTDGSQAWRVKPTVRTPGDPGGDSAYAEIINGWPVVAEVHGLVLVKYRLDWNSMYSPFGAWPVDNAAMRTGLTNSPIHQTLFVLDLDDGTVPFVANIGHGGFGDGSYMPMGPQPVVKKFGDGSEVVYTVIRGDNTTTDGRADSKYGEMVLDDVTAAGFNAGYVRFIQYGDFACSVSCPVGYQFPPTDEQPNTVVSGNQLLGGHWALGQALQITDRSVGLGSFISPILSTPLSHFVTSTDSSSVPTGFSSSHYYGSQFAQRPDFRVVPYGFYIYWNQGSVYDQYWREYASWVVSDGTVYFVSGDGAVIALESGDPLGPTATPTLTPTPGAATPTPTPTSTPAPTSTPGPVPTPTPLPPDVIMVITVEGRQGSKQTILVNSQGVVTR